MRLQALATNVPGGTSWIDIISSVGFPIFMCLALSYYVLKEAVTSRERIDNLSQVLNNNTIVIEKLLQRMETD